MTRFRILTSAFAIAGLIVVTQPAHAQASAASVAQEQDHQAHHPATEQAPDVKAQEAQMMDMQRKMMADMKAMDARLDALVAKMNTATGEAKINAIAELLTAVVQQRTAMGDMMMQAQMMGQMMQMMHGQAGQQMGGVK